MKTPRHLLTAVLGILIFATLAKAADDTLKIGVMLCLSADCAEWGTNSLHGVQLAAEELNLKGGIAGKNVELVVQDSHDTTPSIAVAAFEKLTEDSQIHFLIGPTWTVGGMPIAPLIAKNKNIVVMSPSVGLKEFNETAPNIFNDWPHDEVATRALAHYAWKQGWKKAAVFGSQDPFCATQTKIFQEEFAHLGGTTVITVEPLPDSRELKTEALKIKAANPDFVMLTHYQYDVIAKNFREIQFHTPLFALLMEKERVKSAQGALEGTIFALYEKPRADFSEAFRKKFSVEPGITADTAYDALMLYAQAIKQSGKSDPVLVAMALRSMKEFSGASGTFSFDEKGAVDKKPVLWRVQGLNYEPVQ